MHPPISNIILFAFLWLIFSLSTIISRSVHVWCKWYHFILFKDFLVLSDAVSNYQCPRPPILFPFSHMTFKPVVDSFGWKHLYPHPASHSCLWPHFSCAHRGTSSSGACFCCHTLSDAVLLALFLGELAAWHSSLLPTSAIARNLFCFLPPYKNNNVPSQVLLKMGPWFWDSLT